MHATVYISTGCGACLLLYLSGVVWPCVSICKPWLSPLQPWQLVDTLSRVCKAPHEGGVFWGFFKRREWWVKAGSASAAREKDKERETGGGWQRKLRATQTADWTGVMSHLAGVSQANDKGQSTVAHSPLEELWKLMWVVSLSKLNPQLNRILIRNLICNHLF